MFINDYCVKKELGSASTSIINDCQIAADNNGHCLKCHKNKLKRDSDLSCIDANLCDATFTFISEASERSKTCKNCPENCEKCYEDTRFPNFIPEVKCLRCEKYSIFNILSSTMDKVCKLECESDEILDYTVQKCIKGNKFLN